MLMMEKVLDACRVILLVRSLLVLRPSLEIWDLKATCCQEHAVVNRKICVIEVFLFSHWFIISVIPLLERPHFLSPFYAGSKSKWDREHKLRPSRLSVRPSFHKKQLIRWNLKLVGGGGEKGFCKNRWTICKSFLSRKKILYTLQ